MGAKGGVIGDPCRGINNSLSHSQTKRSAREYSYRNCREQGLYSVLLNTI